MHAIFLASALPLFVGVLLSDLAYAGSFEVQWKNFASWLLVGGLAMSFIALVWAIVDLARTRGRGMRRLLYCGLLLVTWILGFVNALVHAADAWGSMPEGLVLSAVIAALSLAATWVGFANYRDRVIT